MWACQCTLNHTNSYKKSLKKLQILSPRQYGWFSQQWLLILALFVLTSERYYFNSHQSYPTIMPRRRKLGVDCGSEWTKGYAEKIKVGKPYRQRGNRTSGELKILGYNENTFWEYIRGWGNQQGWSDWRNLQACKFEAPAVLVVSSFMCFLQGNLFLKKK